MQADLFTWKRYYSALCFEGLKKRESRGAPRDRLPSLAERVDAQRSSVDGIRNGRASFLVERGHRHGRPLTGHWSALCFRRPSQRDCREPRCLARSHPRRGASLLRDHSLAHGCLSARNRSAPVDQVASFPQTGPSGQSNRRRRVSN